MHPDELLLKSRLHCFGPRARSTSRADRLRRRWFASKFQGPANAIVGEWVFFHLNFREVRKCRAAL
jgi:hypothetical protein